MIRHVFILNPEAGKRNVVSEAVERIKKAFLLNTDRKDETYSILLTEKSGDATVFARQACLDNPGYTRIYACGGDGTLHETVNGIVGAKNVALCPVPVGSGNDFIRYFEKIPKSRFLDVSADLHGETMPCDVLRCDDVYALNNFSVGLDAVTAKRQNKVKSFPFVSGGAAYKIALGYSFLSAMKHPIRFELDGEEMTVGGGNITLAVIGNGKYYGGGFKATPCAKIDDGLIDFITIPTLSRAEFLKYVGIYKRGEHLDKSFVHYRQCRKVKLLSPQSIWLQADGEVFEKQDPEISVVPAAIRIILPQEP